MSHVVQFSSVAQSCLFANPWITAHQASLSITNSWSSLRLMSIESVMPSSHLILCHPLLLLPQSLPASESFPMSQLFAWGGLSTGVSASASFLPKKSRADLLQNELVGSPCSPRDSQEPSPTPSSKASILWRSAFFTVQLSHPDMTTGKTIALTRQTFVGKVMCLLLNMLSRLVITFLPRSKRLLISWLQSPSEWFWSPKNKVWHCFHCFPIYFPWSDGTGLWLLNFVPRVFCGEKVAIGSTTQNIWVWFGNSQRRFLNFWLSSFTQKKKTQSSIYLHSSYGQLFFHSHL